MNKLLLILSSALLLGGCTLTSQLWSESATDANLASPTPTPHSSQAPASDPALDAQPTPGTGTDYSSLESDLSSTVILEEDFSDLD